MAAAGATGGACDSLPVTPCVGLPVTPCVGLGRENDRVDLARVSWLATVIVLLVAVVVLVFQGYAGYAGVTLAVALSAAINLR